MTFTDANKAYRQIKENILMLEMTPGSIIRESALMEELGLGRTPIREALKQLQTENLVVIASRRGAFVADITVTDLQQIYEVRIELEALCARLATQRIRPEQLAEMKEVIAQCQTERQNADRTQLMVLDRRFHHALARAAANKFLYKELALFYNFSLRIWNLAISRVQIESIDLKSHIDLVAAIEAKDALQAEKMMRRHIQHFHDTVKQYL